MQPNDYSQPSGNPGGAPGQPGVQSQPQFAPPQPAPQLPVTPGGPASASYSVELAAQMTGRPIVPSQPITQQPGVQSQPQFAPPQPYAAPAQPYPANPYATPVQPVVPALGQQYAVPQQTLLVPADSPKSRTRLVALLAVPLLVLVLVAGGFVYLHNKHTPAGASLSANKSAQKAVAASGATGELTSLKSFSLVAPSADQLSGLTSKGTDATTHLERYLNSDQSCTLSFGDVPTGVGATGDVGAVAAASLAAVKKEDPNVQVTGPNKVAALKLKADDGKTYALPTVNYAFTDAAQDGGTLVETYSTYQKTDGSHAVVFTFCKSDTPNQQSALNDKVTALQPMAGKITIKAK